MTMWRIPPTGTLPSRVRVFGWLLVVAGCFFAWIYAASPGAFFLGVAAETFAEKFGLYSTTVRILGSVLGILIALALNSAALMALMLAVRIFIEFGDVVVGLILNGGPDANTVSLTVLAGLELYMLIFLLRRQNANVA